MTISEFPAGKVQWWEGKILVRPGEESRQAFARLADSVPAGFEHAIVSLQAFRLMEERNGAAGSPKET